MNYELAKELKEAGFETAMSTGYRRGHYDDSAGSEHLVYLPALSELIAACVSDDKFLQLNYWPTTKQWFAEHPTFQGKGPTPEEAVARLWLALNKK